MATKKTKKTDGVDAPVEASAPEIKMTASEQAYVEKYPYSLRAIMIKQGVKVVEV